MDLLSHNGYIWTHFQGHLQTHTCWQCNPQNKHQNFMLHVSDANNIHRCNYFPTWARYELSHTTQFTKFPKTTWIQTKQIACTLLTIIFGTCVFGTCFAYKFGYTICLAEVNDKGNVGSILIFTLGSSYTIRRLNTLSFGGFTSWGGCSIC